MQPCRWPPRQVSGGGGGRGDERENIPSLSPEHAIVLVAVFDAGVIDAMAGGGGLVQMPALFAAFPHEPHATLRPG